MEKLEPACSCVIACYYTTSSLTSISLKIFRPNMSCDLGNNVSTRRIACWARKWDFSVNSKFQSLTTTSKVRPTESLYTLFSFFFFPCRNKMLFYSPAPRHFDTLNFCVRFLLHFWAPPSRCQMSPYFGCLFLKGEARQQHKIRGGTLLPFL